MGDSMGAAGDIMAGSRAHWAKKPKHGFQTRRWWFASPQDVRRIGYENESSPFTGEVALLRHAQETQSLLSRTLEAKNSSATSGNILWPNYCYCHWFTSLFSGWLIQCLSLRFFPLFRPNRAPFKSFCIYLYLDRCLFLWKDSKKRHTLLCGFFSFNSFRSVIELTLYRPATPFGNSKKILEDLFSSVLPQFKNIIPLKTWNNTGIFQIWKLRNHLMVKILRISLQLNFTKYFELWYGFIDILLEK